MEKRGCDAAILGHHAKSSRLLAQQKNSQKETQHGNFLKKVSVPSTLDFGRSLSSRLHSHSRGVATAQNPVIDWNAVAVTTALNGNPVTSPGSATAGGTSIYLAYVHLAVYDAVNAIDRRFQSYGPKIRAPHGASPEAAAIAAAYTSIGVLLP